MIEICDIDKRRTRPEVAFRFKGIDMVADLDPGVIQPVVIRGTAQGCDVDIRFSDYEKLQEEINYFIKS